MEGYLCQTTEVYHVNTEKAAKDMIETAKKSSEFQLIKYLCEYKEIKQKGEVVDTYFKLTLVKSFNDIKEPLSFVKVNYEIEDGYFPSTERETEDEN